MFIFQNTHDFFYVAHKYETTPNIRHFYGHTHEHYEVFLFIKGDASFNIEGNKFMLSPLDIIIIPPHYYHCLILDGISPYERYVLEIPSTRIDSSWETLFSQPKLFNIAHNPKLQDIFYRLDTYQELLPEDDFAQMCEYLVQECLLVLKSSFGNDSIEHSYDPLTKRILHYINENLSLPLSVEALSEHFFLSKSHIQNVFYQNMKIGVKSYIVQKKMLLAKDLLESGKKPYEVAEELGYSDYTTFYKNFRKHYKASPKLYVSKKNKHIPVI
ncbi:MAG: helix-turn-helix domain-containing protein [Clostridia bacterium]|nr:helix-turn-helix domain-containing protein [Clostridia bacterium]